MHAAVLEDRGVVAVGGPEAGDFLQRLFTNDVLGLKAAEARYAALLTPQGKVLIDFFAVAAVEEGTPLYVLDCPLRLAADLVRRLTMYRLRARVTIEDRSAGMGVAAFWPGRPDTDCLVYRDPRHDDLGFRVAGLRVHLDGLVGTSEPDLYRTHRILVGAPEGGLDFPYGDTFPHEANLDRMRGLDFTKGCYVGQEVVSRVEHRGGARKRIMAVSFEGDPPPHGSEILVGGNVIGTMGSSVEGHGLAMVRLDRAADAVATGTAVTSAGTQLMMATG